MTQICLLFQLLSQPSLPQINLLSVPFPCLGPSVRAAGPSPALTPGSGQQELAHSAPPPHCPPLAVLRGAGLSHPGIQLPSLEWAPSAGRALAAQGRFYRSRNERKKRSGNGAAFPQATEGERVGGERGVQSLTGSNGLAQLLSPRSDREERHTEPILRVSISRMLGQTPQFHQKRSEKRMEPRRERVGLGSVGEETASPTRDSQAEMGARTLPQTLFLRQGSDLVDARARTANV